MKYIMLMINIFAICGSQPNWHRNKRIYGLCPPNFERIGSACYFVSDEKLNWLDAHFECKDRNSKLAEPVKITDRQLRKYLIATDKSDDVIWIGGSYEWNKRKWVWGYSGYDIKHQSFSQMETRNAPNLQYHCAVLNPELKYRWSARPCVDTHRFICQHKMPRVNAKNRDKVYNRWNDTYPNQKANEIMLDITDSGNVERNARRHKLDITSEHSLNMDSRYISVGISRFARKRPEWSSTANDSNNETFDKSTKKPTDFDKIAERKRQKEIRRRYKVQQQRRQKDVEFQIVKKVQDIIHSEKFVDQNFPPPPVTEVLMFHETKTTNETTKINKSEKSDANNRIVFTTKPPETTLLIEIPTETQILSTTEKPIPSTDGLTSLPLSEEKRNIYLKKIKELIREERKRIEQEELRREILKRNREENIEKLNKYNDALVIEEKIPDIEWGNEEKKLKQDDLIREKKAKEEEEKNKSLVKQAARMEALRKYKEKLRKLKEEKFRGLESGNSTEDGDANNKTQSISEDEKKARLQKLRDRLQKLTPEQRQRFHELRMQRKQNQLKRSYSAIN